MKGGHLLTIGTVMGQVVEFIYEVYVKWEIQIRLDGQNEPKVDLWDPGFH